MTNSKGSVVVGDEGAQRGLSGALVVPDGGGEGEQALGDAHDDAGGGATPVAFEIELTLQRVVDRLDELAQRFEEGSTGTWLFVGSCRAQKGGDMVGEETLELGAGVALVGQDGLAGPGGEQVGVGLEQVTGDLALVDLGVRQRERDRQPGGGADQMEAQAPEVAGVAGAVSVASPSGQLGALGGGTGSAALDGGGIDHPGVVAPQVGVGGQQADEVNELLGGASQPLVVAGLAGQVGKQVAQVGAGVAQPTGFGHEPQQRLQHRQRDELGVGQL